MSKTVLIAAIIAFVPLAAAFADDEDVASVYGTFSFADSSGTRVLALAPIDHPERVHNLIVKPGRRLRVTYEGTQDESPRSTGRQIYQNFRSTAGQRFRIEGGSVSPGYVGFLATDTLVSIGRVVEVQADLRPCESNAPVTGIDREVTHCSTLANYGGRGRIRLYEFAPQGKSFLASIVLQERDRMIRLDLPSEAQDPSDPSEVWRVGDEGTIPPEAIDILFVIKGKGATFMAYAWGAEEGEDLVLFKTSGDGSVLDSVAFAYRYWVPQ